MRSRCVDLSLCFVTLAVLDVARLSAQSVQIPFAFDYEFRSQATTVGLGGLISFPATTVGQQTNVTFRVASQSDVVWILRSASITGAGFSVSVSPVEIAAGGRVGFPVSFVPVTSGLARAVLSLRLEGPGGQIVAPTFSLSGTGGQDSVVIAFLANASANPVPLSAGERIRMIVAAAGGRQTGTIILSNRGVAAISIEDVRVSGNDAFEAGGLPLLPANLGPGGELRFFLTFAPVTRGPFNGQLAITIGGAARAFVLEGELSTASFAYERVDGSSATPIAAGATISFPSAAVGAARQMVRIRIRNAGSLSGRIGTVSVTGTAFQLVDPPTLPITLAAGESVIISVGFAPREPGPSTGRLVIEDAGFELAGSGLGGRFQLSMNFGGEPVELFEGATALLPNTVVGDRRPFSITVVNMGNQAASITSLLVSGPGFSLLRTPPLPSRLEPGASLTVDAQFAPGSVGAADGRFQIDQIVVPLRGVGAAPPPVPAIRFLNVTEKMEALAQPDLVLELAETYPYDITGRLTLTFAPDNFIDDPAVQLISGGRTADFRIPAGSARAVFANGRPAIRLQTGSSAGRITLAVGFSVAGIPAPSVSPFEISIPAAPPLIRSVQIVSRTSSRIDLTIAGASTARTVTKLRLKLRPLPRANLQTTELEAKVDRIFETWYRNPQSRPLGSQFTATLQLDISGNVNVIDTIGVIFENELGASEARSVSLRE